MIVVRREPDLPDGWPASIDIRLGVPVELDDIRALHPDVAIVATGGISTTLDIPIDPHASVQTAESMLQSETDLNAASVVVIGAGMVGCETALACARRGARVFLLEALPDIAGDCEPISRAVLLKHLDQEDAHILSNVRVLGIASDNVQVEQSGVESGEIKIMDQIVGGFDRLDIIFAIRILAVAFPVPIPANEVSIEKLQEKYNDSSQIQSEYQYHLCGFAMPVQDQRSHGYPGRPQTGP